MRTSLYLIQPQSSKQGELFNVDYKLQRLHIMDFHCQTQLKVANCKGGGPELLRDEQC